MSAIEDLHGRLKNNVDSIQQLNEQLKAVNRDNIKLKGEVERERAARCRLEIQLEKTRSQTISNLQTQVIVQLGILYTLSPCGLVVKEQWPG